MARTRKATAGGVEAAKADDPFAEAGPENLEAVVEKPPPAGDDGGRALVEAMEHADRKSSIERGRSAIFDNANAPRERAIDPRMPALVERVFDPIDWNKAFDRFDKWMSLGTKRGEEAYIRLAHEEGPEIAKLILDVAIQVQFARDSWELENDAFLGAMRDEATKCLEHEKERKLRTKMITEADVEKKCASMFPDEWARQEKKRLQFKQVEHRAKECYVLANLRCRILESMMARLR